MSTKTAISAVQPDSVLDLSNANPTRCYTATVGTLVEHSEDGVPAVEFEASNGDTLRCSAASTVALDPKQVGHPVMLMFLDGELRRPVIIGNLSPGSIKPKVLTRTTTLTLDGQELALEADKQITLRCGKSSITLTRDGKIVLRGIHLLSRASSVNRIRGGTIKLN